MKVFLFEMYRSGKGNITQGKGFVVASTEMEALGLLLEKYEKMEAANFTVVPADMSKNAVTETHYEYYEE